MKNNGFTLIELIVVIGILSILAVGSMVALNPLEQFKKANDSRRKADLSQIQKAVETYYQDNGSYPSSSLGGSALYRITSNAGLTTVEWGTSWSPYMNLLPKDPSASKNYVYYSAGQSYYLYASLDRGSLDPQSCQGMINGECQSIGANIGSAKSCGGPCNFGVSSPNVSP